MGSRETNGPHPDSSPGLRAIHTSRHSQARLVITKHHQLHTSTNSQQPRIRHRHHTTSLRPRTRLHIRNTTSQQPRPRPIQPTHHQICRIRELLRPRHRNIRITHTQRTKSGEIRKSCDAPIINHLTHPDPVCPSYPTDDHGHPTTPSAPDLRWYRYQPEGSTHAHQTRPTQRRPPPQDQRVATHRCCLAAPTTHPV